MGAVQSFVFPAGSAVGSFPVGSGGSAYTASAQVAAATITPLFSGSTFLISGWYGAAYTTALAFEYTTCLYLNSTGFPIAMAFNQVFQTNSFVLNQTSFGCKLASQTAGVPFTLNVCMYKGSAVTPALSGPFATNGLCVDEVVYNSPSATTPLVVSPTGLSVVNSGTPVLLATIPVPTNASVLCAGSWFASDQTNFTTGNGGDFFFVGQRAAGVASIVNSNVPSNIIGTLGTAPYISVSVSSGNNAIQIYAVGATAKTYQFYLTFNTL